MIEEGSQNVYADLGCANADAMQRKTMLIVRISDVISAKGLGLAQASAGMGIEALCLESWLKGRFRDADEAVLNRPGFRGGCLVKVKQPHRRMCRVGCSSLPQPRPAGYSRWMSAGAYG
ncbi:MAG: XRE family transcriptional regulator [Achromobacter pulmonis]